MLNGPKGQNRAKLVPNCKLDYFGSGFLMGIVVRSVSLLFKMLPEGRDMYRQEVTCSKCVHCKVVILSLVLNVCITR